jgi:GT2 family glycosyltransferase
VGPPVAVVIPVFGRQELTHALITDLAREDPASLRVIVVDNGGDYEAFGEEQVLRQQENLGWLRGSNLGIREALTKPCQAVLLLNNDTRLSTGFVAGVAAALAPGRVGIVGPRYDDHWAHQHHEHVGSADRYVPGPRSRPAPFVDGTCMLLRRQVIETVGLLDESAFGRTGWGADIDLALRSRRAGWRVVVTDRAFLRHDAGSTARRIQSPQEYWERGDADLREGLERKWGPKWRRLSGLEGRRWAVRQLVNEAVAVLGRSSQNPG